MKCIITVKVVCFHTLLQVFILKLVRDSVGRAGVETVFGFDLKDRRGLGWGSGVRPRSEKRNEERSLERWRT